MGGNAVGELSTGGTVSSGGGGRARGASNNGSFTSFTTKSQNINGGYTSKGGDGVLINIEGNDFYYGAGGGGAGTNDIANKRVVMSAPFSLFLLHNHFITKKNLKKNPAM